jgi:hypothetical protein
MGDFRKRYKEGCQRTVEAMGSFGEAGLVW